MCKKMTLLVSIVLVLSFFLSSVTQGADPNLVGWWKFNEVEGGIAFDSSGNMLDGALVDNPQWVPGKINGALQFDGVGDWVNCGNSPLLDIRDRVTMACWVKVTAFTKNWEAFVTKGDNAYRISRSQSGGTCHMGVNGTKLGWFDGKIPVDDGGWHHVAGVYDGTRAILYVDGSLDTAKSNSGQINSSTADNLYIGANAAQAGRQITGTMDDVRVYNRALKSSEVAVLLYGESYPFAFDPDPADKAALSVPTITLRWQPGGSVTAVNGHKVYLDTDPQKVTGRKDCQINGVSTTNPFYAIPAPLGLGRTYYWIVDEVNETDIWPGTVWSFTIVSNTATNPVPGDDAELVDPNVSLEWIAGVDATQHHVYLGTNLANVTAGTGGTDKGTVTELHFYAGVLQSGITYYWRIDEYDGELTYPGEVWSFTTIGPRVGVIGAYYNNTTLDGEPVLVRTDYNIDFDWGIDTPDPSVNVDNFSVRWSGVLEVPSTDTYTFGIYCLSEDGVRLWVNGRQIINNWPASDPNGFEGTIDLNAGQVSIVMEFQETAWGAVAKLSWQSPSLVRQVIPIGAFSLPLAAATKSPSNGATEVSRNPTLRCVSGMYAATHDVYFGTDFNDVHDAGPSTPWIYKGRQSDTSYTPGTLEFNTTYYWRIDEVNEAHPDQLWKGDVWSFTTGNFIVLDDFEAYDDLCNRIFYTWVDGAGITTGAECVAVTIPGNQSGSTVGNAQEPFADQTTFHGDSGQSMPFWFNNAGSPFYSEAVREFAPARSFTSDGADTLRLYLRGAPAAFIETRPGTLIMNGTGTDIWGTGDEFRFAYQVLKGNGSIVAKVEGVSNVNSNAKAGVMIRESWQDPSSTHALVDVTPSVGLEFIHRDQVGGETTSTTVGGLTAPYWVKLTRNGSLFTAQCSTDGVTWTSVGTDPAASSVTITMANEVYIGLAVTSRAANLVCGAKFSNVSTEGGVSGSWQVAEIGVPQVSGNLPESCYVMVEDSAGQSKVYSHPDTSVIATGIWEQVDVPLSYFTSAGINVGAVRKLILGVGDRDTPKAGGTGNLNIDDILLAHVGP